MDPQGIIGPYKAPRTHGFKAYGPKLHKHFKASALLSLWGAWVSWGVVLLGFSLKGFAASGLVLSAFVCHAEAGDPYYQDVALMWFRVYLWRKRPSVFKELYSNYIGKPDKGL